MNRDFNTVLTHNKHIFVRPKIVCLFWEMCLFRVNVLILVVLIMSGDSTSKNIIIGNSFKTELELFGQ